MVLAGLPALLAAPPPAPAQTCTPAPTTGPLPTVTYAGTYTAGIDCHTLTNGLEMTLGPNLKIGTEASPVAVRAIGIDAQGDNTGDKHVVVRGSGMMYTDQSGLNMNRDGTGLLQLEFTAGKIVSGGTEEGVGIYLWHQGEANRETAGIRLVSGADIDLSAHEDFAKEGIHAETIDAPATATIPITIQVTGGTIDVSDPASSTPAEGGTAIKVEQYAKGDIAITVESAARLGTTKAIAGAYGIYAELRPASEGNIMITHRGQIYAGTGIEARSEATSAQKGDITITTATGSVIVAKEFKEYSGIYEHGLYARISEAGSTGDVTITHQGDLTADGRGIEAVNEGTGSVTVTTGAGSQATAGEYGIRAALGSASAGNITITHQGDLTADGRGIEAVNEGTGSVTVTTGAGSQATAGEYGIRAALGSASAGDIMLTHNGELKAGGNGIEADHDGTGSVTVTTGTGSQITADGAGIEASLLNAAGEGPITITHHGALKAGGNGIDVDHDGTGSVTVTTGPGSQVIAGGRGIDALNEGTGGLTVTTGTGSQITAGDGESGIRAGVGSASTGDLTITHHGALTAGGKGIDASNEGTGGLTVTTGTGSQITAGDGESGIRAGVGSASTGDLTITHHGALTAGGKGIDASNEGTGGMTVTTGTGSQITAGDGESGIRAGVGSASTGDLTITHHGALTAGGKGIDALNEGTGGVTVTTGTGSQISAGDGEPGMRAALGSTSTGDITITHHGALTAGGNGIEADHDGTGSVTLTTGTGSQITADSDGIQASLDAASNITITHHGALTAGGRGIDALNEGTGGVTVTTGTGSQISADSDGIQASLDAAGNITITHHGAIEAGGRGIFTSNNGAGDVTITTGKGSQIIARGDATYSSGINASVRSSAATGDVTVTHGGEIVAKEEGIYVSNRNTSDKGTGAIRVTTTAGSKVTAEKQGILVWHRGTGQASVTIRGTVMGDNAYISGSETTYAGVHIQVKDTDTRAGGGGEIVLGPMAHLSAKSGTAIKIDERAGAVTVILEEDQDGLAGHLEGKILSAGEGLSAGTVLSKTTEDAGTTMMFKARAGETGTERTLSVGDSVNMRGETQGIYDKVYRTQLMRITGGHEFKKLSETRLYHDRTRVYEALPAVLLDLNGQLPYQERMAAPRDGDGLWARLAAGDGARRPARATTARGFTGRALAWDVAQYGFEGGLDFRPAATERLLLGVSLHARQGTATVAHGGTIEVSGFGGGGAATYRDAAGFYLDGRFSYTYFDDVDLTSRTRGAVQADLSGHGYALGLEAGKRLGWMGLDHVALTPRARVVWSTVKLEDFADLAGSGRVALETATSLKGRLGVLAETAFGGATLEDWTGDGGRLFASLDVEHEFAVDRETVASGTALASEVQATWGRVGLGGTLIWTEGLTLSGEGFYATAGSDNTDFGGSLTLTLRF